MTLTRWVGFFLYLTNPKVYQMAFNKSMSFNSTAPKQAAASDKSWQNLGYINFMLNSPSGAVSKLGAIGLAPKNAAHVEFFGVLMSPDKATFLESIAQQIVLKFNPAASGDEWDFLDGMVAYDAAANNNKEKPVGYINVLLPDESGELAQLGTLQLFASDYRENKLFRSLSSSPEVCEKNLANIKNSLSLSFYSTSAGAPPTTKPKFLVLVNKP